MIYAFDSSTIELCLKLCSWAEFHHGKGAFKMHTLMDLRGSIPTFVLLTPSKVNDVKVMDKIPVEASAFYLMDKGYVAFEKLYKYFQVKGAYFVTRAKDNMSYEGDWVQTSQHRFGRSFGRDYPTRRLLLD